MDGEKEIILFPTRITPTCWLIQFMFSYIAISFRIEQNSIFSHQFYSYTQKLVGDHLSEFNHNHFAINSQKKLLCIYVMRSQVKSYPSWLIDFGHCKQWPPHLNKPTALERPQRRIHYMHLRLQWRKFIIRFLRNPFVQYFTQTIIFSVRAKIFAEREDSRTRSSFG